MDYLIEILEKSVKKHGKDKVLTLGHLLNILKLSEKREDDDSEADYRLASVLDLESQMDM